MAEYQIVTDATADISAGIREGLPPVRVVPRELEMGGREYVYGPGGNITAEGFYRLQRSGQFAQTSAISPAVYTEVFSSCLREGKDVLYLCFSSGLSSTIQSARIGIQELEARFPERRILCLDTLCASIGEGFLVREAARKQAEGLSLDELADWVMARRLSVCHWFTVDSFTHLRHGGRVGAAAAALGAALQIKPLLRVDEKGELQVAGKPRGRKRAVAALLEQMERGWTPEEGTLVLVGHASSPDAAEEVREQVGRRFPSAEIRVADLGPVIGSHTGPGMFALMFWGTAR